MRRASIVLALAAIVAIAWYASWTGDEASARGNRDLQQDARERWSPERARAALEQSEASLLTPLKEAESGAGVPGQERVAASGAGRRQAGLDLILDLGCGLQPFRWPELHFTSRGSGEAFDLLAGERERIDRFPPGGWFVTVDGPAWTGGPVDVPEPRGTLALSVESRVRYGGMLVEAGTLEPLAVFHMTLEYESRDLAGRSITMYETVLVDGGDGSFCAVGLPPSDGPQRLVFTAEGFGEARTDWLPSTSGTRIEGLFVELARLDEGWISGRVVDDRTGRAIEEAWVCLVPTTATTASLLLVDGGPMLIAGGSYRPESPPDRWRVATDADGAFRLSADHGRPLRLYAWKPGLLPRVTDVLTMPDAGDLLLEPVALTRGARIQGRVVDGGDDPGRVPEGVWIEGEGTDRRVGIGSDGAFTIEGLEAGSYELRVDVIEQRSDGSSGIVIVRGERVSLESGEEREVEILLGSARPGATLSGSVLRPADPDLVEWRLVAFLGADLALGVFHNQALDRTGAFTIQGAPQGVIYVVTKGSSAAGDRVAFASLRLDVGAESLEGLVLDAARNPVTIDVGDPPSGPARYEFKIEPLGGDGIVRHVISSDSFLFGQPGGTLALYGLTEGDYRLRGESLVQEFSIGAGPVEPVLLQWGE